jgi:hypothetical protein
VDVNELLEQRQEVFQALGNPVPGPYNETEAAFALDVAVAQFIWRSLPEETATPDDATEPITQITDSQRLSTDDKINLLRLVALQTIRNMLPFETALQIHLSLEGGLTWNEMAKHLGTSRQALHRKYSATVREIAETDDVTDLAYRKLHQKQR